VPITGYITFLFILHSRRNEKEGTPILQMNCYHTKHKCTQYRNYPRHKNALLLFETDAEASAQSSVWHLPTEIPRGCIQKFPDWPPAARITNSTSLCH